MSSVNQLSFTSGELSQSIWGRTDLVKYATGLKICQNFIVRAHGGDITARSQDGLTTFTITLPTG